MVTIKVLHLRYCLTAWGAFVCFLSPALADSNSTDIPQLVIVANRAPSVVNNVGRSIDRMEVSNNDSAVASNNLTNVLSPAPGVYIPEIGGPGAPGVMPMEIRGFRNGGTKLLLNGMVLDDPSSISGNYEAFYGALNLSDIKSVELLKGSAGVLYGSDAQSGVLNLIPYTPEKGQSLNFQMEGGAYETFSENIQINQGTEDMGLFSSLFREDSSGLDTHGDYNNTTLLLNSLAKPFAANITINPIFRFVNASNDLDTSPTLNAEGHLVTNQDTENNTVDANAYFLGVATLYEAQPGIDAQLNIYHNRTNRNYYFEFFGLPSTSDLTADSFHVENQFAITSDNKQNKLLFGLDYNFQHVSTDADSVTDDESREIYGAYLHDTLAIFQDYWELAGGVRVTHVSDISSTFPTLEASNTFHIPALGGKVHSSIAQGFRAPTLFETKGNMQDYNTGQIVNVGNDDLDKEESLSWDSGYEQTLFDDKIKLDITFFQIDSEQTILFDYANFTHINGGSGISQGIETALDYQVNNWLTNRWAFTYLDKAQGLDHSRRQRTPWSWATCQLSAVIEKFTLTSMLKYRGEQQIEFYGVSEEASEHGVFLADLFVGYQIDSNAQVYVEGNNIFNQQYTEGGYSMPDAAFYVGLRLSL
ncbi:MAG: TonB-dependent receptor [Deltaproteobacteria bacterium]|nr:TonB-dependent receptor [Deltaproteobacteria bacterium]